MQPSWVFGAPRWVAIASEDMGLAEIPGAATAPKIKQWLRQLGAWWTDDETPWCGVACAAWFQAAGIAIPKHYYRARAWADGWGTQLASPVLGSVVVLDREGGGHVGLLVGVTDNGRLLILGGNQGNRVSVREFALDRNPRYFWPPGEPIPSGSAWAYSGQSSASTTEA